MRKETGERKRTEKSDVHRGIQGDQERRSEYGRVGGVGDDVIVCVLSPRRHNRPPLARLRSCHILRCAVFYVPFFRIFFSTLSLSPPPFDVLCFLLLWSLLLLSLSLSVTLSLSLSVDTSTMLITFILIGKNLEAIAKGRTCEAIEKLVSLQVSSHSISLFLYLYLSLPPFTKSSFFLFISSHDCANVSLRRPQRWWK